MQTTGSPLTGVQGECQQEFGLNQLQSLGGLKVTEKRAESAAENEPEF